MSDLVSKNLNMIFKSPKGETVHALKDINFKLNKGELLQVDGTNVVRVPFGVRQPKKQRPAKLSPWATLVLPLQSFDSPTPPPHAA